jgi:Cd2+/Zn2+-exporting ATPase
MGHCSCCEHDHEEEEDGALWQLLLGTAIFLFTFFSGLIPENYTLICYIVAYLLLGKGIILAAGRNIIHGRPFDETFLMVIATLGAFAIGEYPEAVGVMFFSRIGEACEERAVGKSRKQIMEAVDMRPQSVQRIAADGTLQTIPAGEAVIGDSIFVRVGDRIPLDGIVLEGKSLIDTSAMTGEPVPILCQAGQQVMSGSINTTGTLKIQVTKVLSESMVSKILQSVETAAARKPHMDRFITRFARVYTPVVVVIAIATALLPSLVTGEWHRWIYTALTFLVISCPCALVLSVPLSFFAGIGTASKYGILFKGGNAIEAMKRVRTIVMDKTGTVTKGDFTVQEINPAGIMAEDELLRLCASVEQASLHPIARSVVAAAKDRGLVLDRTGQSKEIAGEGIVAEIGTKTILCGNQKLMDRYGIKLPQLSQITYGAELYIAVDGIFCGNILISDTIKNDAARAVQDIRKLGITTAMLTGDSQQAAQYIAAQTGIDEVRAKLLPQDKVDEMDALRHQYGPVLFVGDGINDAPVLAGADIGAAMGSGADAAIEAADVIFLNSQMSAIPQAISIAYDTLAIARQNIIFALGVKGIIMLAGFVGYASMWAAVFADSGVAALCVLNSVRMLYKK